MSPFSSVTVMVSDTRSPTTSSRRSGVTISVDGPRTTVASTSAVSSPAAALMMEVPSGPTEVSSPPWLTVITATSLDRKVTG